MAKDDTIIVKTAVDLKGLSDGISSVSKEIKKAYDSGKFDIGKAVSSGLSKITTPAGIAVSAIAGVTASIVAMTSATIKSSSDLLESSQKMGVSVDTYQRLGYVAGQSGTDIETLSKSMRSLVKAADGTPELFDSIGVSVRDANGQMLSQEELLKNTLLALSAMPESVERSALSLKLLGKSALEIQPMLNAGRESLNAYFDSADTGVTVSNRLAEASDRWSDSLDTVMAIGAKARNEAMTPLIETMANFVELLLEADLNKTPLKFLFDYLNMQGKALSITFDALYKSAEWALKASGAIKKTSAELFDELGKVNEKLNDPDFMKRADVLAQNSLRKKKDELAEELRLTIENEGKILSEKAKTAKIIGGEVPAKTGTTKAKKADAIEPFILDIDSNLWLEQTIKAGAEIGNVLARSAEDNFQKTLSEMDMSWTDYYSAELTSDGSQAEIDRTNSVRDAKISAGIEVFNAATNIADMLTKASISRDERELSSWRQKEQEKISSLNISGRRRAQMEKELDNESKKREAEIQKRKIRAQIAQVWATTAGSVAQIWGNYLAHYSALGATIGIPLASGLAKAATGMLVGTAGVQTGIMAGEISGYAGGGVAGEESRSSNGGDNMLATLRKGERVLNARQQARLDDVLFGSGSIGGGVNITINGDVTDDKLRELEDMILKLKSYGRI